MAHDDQRRHEIVAALRGVALFRGLPDAELAGLATRMVRKRYERDEVIFGQGEPGHGLYIVARGHVGISRQSPEGDELLRVVESRRLKRYLGLMKRLCTGASPLDDKDVADDLAWLNGLRNGLIHEAEGARWPMRNAR